MTSLRAKPKGLFLTSLSLLLCLLLYPSASLAQTDDLVITGVIDGPLTGGIPKAVELYARNAIADLSIYGLGSANNGSGSDGEEFSFPAVSVAAGQCLYVATEAAAFQTWFGFAPDFTSAAVSINGDDAIELFTNGGVSDVFGEVTHSGAGAWAYTDGWAYRTAGTGPDGSTFAIGNWTFSGTNALDGESDNASAATPFPTGSYGGCTGSTGVPQLLLSEIVVTPTGGEFVEIYNPGSVAIDLSDVYLSDATFAPGSTYYYNLVTGSNLGGGGFGDFTARFPAGASIAPGEYQTVALAGSAAFVTEYIVSPTYELFDDGIADSAAAMREAAPGSINGQGGLTNSGEMVVLFYWDGASDLVTDLDYAVWGDKDEAVDKSGVAIDGPDADADASSYQNDTAITAQDVIASGGHAFGDSFQRIDLDEGSETKSGGNGAGGHDETSEDLSLTWSSDSAPTPNAPAPVPATGWVINEIHADPDGSIAGDANADGTRDSTDDEFVEIVNNTGGPVDISGWSLSDGFTMRHTFPAGTVVPDLCAVVVFGGGTPAGSFGNATAQTASTGSLGLNNSGDTVTLNNGAVEIAAAQYGGEGGANQSLTRDPDILGSFVQHSGATGSAGALFSPGTQIDGTPFVGCPASWVINEIHADPASGTDGDANGDGERDFSDDEFVEIYNNTGVDADISGWTIADASSSRHTFPAGTIVPAGCAVTVFGGGSPTGSFGGTVVQTASTGALGLNNSGDSLTLSDGLGTVAATNYGSDAGDNQSLTLDPDIVGSAYVKHSLATGAGGALYSPGTQVDGTRFGGCPVTAEIYQIQGSGLASPFEGASVITRNNVVTAVGPDGFTMQTPSERTDGDALTSDGIYVFTGGAPTVAVGDLVDVEGTVIEFFDFTQFSVPAITVVGSGSLPAPIALDATLPSPDPTVPSCAFYGDVEANNFECLEGMLVSVADGIVGGPNQRFIPDPVAEVFITVGSERAFRESGILFPGLSGLPVWDGNPEVFELDPDRLGLPGIQINAGSTFSAVGVIGYEFSDYELWPSSLQVVEDPLPAPVRARTPTEFTVGSLNLFRLFDDVDDPEDAAERDDPGADANYLLRLEKFALYIDTAMDCPDILAVQEVEKLAVLDDLADEIEQLSAGSCSYAATYLFEGNDVGTIDVGFLVRDTVTPDPVTPITQLGKDELLTFDGSLLHDRPPLLFFGEYSAAGPSVPIAVLNLHQRSLGGIDGSNGERVRQKRLEQAESVARMVQTFQDEVAGGQIVVVGDFNAFQFSDGYVDVVGHIAGDFDPMDELVCDTNTCPDLVEPNLTVNLPDDPAERYSFIFRGSAQILDHALSNLFVDPFVNEVQYARGNADNALVDVTEPGTANRASDHDGLVLFLEADDDGVPAELDLCPGTAIPELTVPTRGLKNNHHALIDNDLLFDTEEPSGNGAGNETTFSIFDTFGCSCEQIIEELGLGNGHRKFGCTTEVIQQFIALQP